MENYYFVRTTQLSYEEDNPYTSVRLHRQAAFKSGTVWYVTSGKGLTSSLYWPPTLTLWVRQKRNSLTHATTLESKPQIAIYMSSRSCGIKSKALEKAITIDSICLRYP